MTRRIKKFLTLAAVGIFGFCILQLAPVYAAPKDDICKGVGLTGVDCSDPATAGTTTKSVNDTVANVIGLFSFVIGIAAVIMIMIGGFKYITSNGDSGSVSSAKNTIIYAVIGLVVAMFAQLIVRFVINRV